MAALVALSGRSTRRSRRASVSAVVTAGALVAAGVVVPASASDAVAAMGPAASSSPVDAVRDPQGHLTAPDAVAAAVNARLSGEPVEDLSQRTAFGSVYALPDGQWTTQQASGPVWVRRGGDGSALDDWASLDLTLKLGADGVVRPVAAPSGLELAGTKRPDAVGGGGGVFASVADPGSGEATTLAWPGDLPQPVLAGKRATYLDVSPGLDLVVEATTSGFEQFFVADDEEALAAAVADPMVAASDAGQLARTADGGLVIEDDAGQVIASTGTLLPPP